MEDDQFGSYSYDHIGEKKNNIKALVSLICLFSYLAVLVYLYFNGFA